MGLRDLIYRISDEIPAEERLLGSLERIATALELIAGVGRPVEALKDEESAILYTNDEEELEKELRREAYEERTGQKLPPGEDVPRPSRLGWPRQRQREAYLPSTDELWDLYEGDSKKPEE